MLIRHATQFIRLWHHACTQDLQRNATRLSTPSAGGSRWLIVAIIVLIMITAGLWWHGGYHSGFIALNHWAHEYPAWLWELFTALGDERIICVASLLFARTYPRLFWSLLCAALLAGLYARGLKPLIDAARPPAVLDMRLFYFSGPLLTQHSFPSGHSVTAGVLFGVLVQYSRWIEWRILFVLLALGAGMSRIALGVHWPIDVTAGLAGGLLAAWLGIRIAHATARVSTSAWLHIVFICVGSALALFIIVMGYGYPHTDGMIRLLALGVLFITARQLYRIDK